MVDFDPTRRQVSISLGTVLGVSLAGCMGGDDDGGDNTENSDGSDSTENSDGTSDTENGDGNDGTETSDEDGGSEAPDPEGSALLGFRLEDENGEEVTIGFDLTFEHAEYADQSVSRSYVGNWDEVVFFGDETTVEKAEEEEWAPSRLPADPIQVYYTGEWNVTIEPNEANDFEPVEETVEITQEDLDETPSDQIIREETFVLEGATSDAERAKEEAVVVEGQYRFDANHAPDTEWGWGVPDASEEPGTSVQQLEWAEADHQRWDIEPVDEEGKWHRIVAAHSDADLVWDLVIDSEKGNWADYHASADVVVGEWDESDEQLWRITPLPSDHPNVEDGDELYKIENKANAASAAPDGEGEEAGADIYTWWYPGQPHHQIILHEQ